MDGYKSAFTADVYCVENKTFSSRECRGEKIPLRELIREGGANIYQMLFAVVATEMSLHSWEGQL